MFSLFIEKKAESYLKGLPQKTRRIVLDKILELREDPFSGGNKEKLEYFHPPAVYRLHVGRSFTVFYTFDNDEKILRIEKIMTIERTHKEYFCR